MGSTPTIGTICESDVMVNMIVLETIVFRRVGSSPTFRTMNNYYVTNKDKTFVIQPLNSRMIRMHTYQHDHCIKEIITLSDQSTVLNHIKKLVTSENNVTISNNLLNIQED